MHSKEYSSGFHTKNYGSIEWENTMNAGLYTKKAGVLDTKNGSLSIKRVTRKWKVLMMGKRAETPKK